MKNEKKIKIITIIFIVLVVFMLIFNRLLFKFKNFLDRSFLPIQSKIYQSAQKVIDMKDSIYLYKDVIKENEKLKKENMELKALNAANQLISEENLRLVRLLEMKDANQTVKNLKFARVIFRDASNINSKFYIDLGANNGIEKNMVAIYNDYLIGRVSEVYDTYSLVIMLTDNSASISVKTKNNLLGIAQGSDTGKNEMYFQPSTFEETLQVGEEILTSGISDIYPEGLKIGKITEINKTANNIFRSIKIKPEFDSKNLKEVMLYRNENVLKDIETMEMEKVE